MPPLPDDGGGSTGSGGCGRDSGGGVPNKAMLGGGLSWCMPWYGMPRAGESGCVVTAELAWKDELAPSISEEPGGGSKEENGHPIAAIDSSPVSDHRLELTTFAWTVGSGGTEVGFGVAGRATRRS